MQPRTVAPAARIKRDERLNEMIRVSVHETTRAETYGSPVGAAIETFDGRIVGGHNISMAGKSMHAEVHSMLTLHQIDYRTTDFYRMLVLFQDIHHKTQEAFPACPVCWADGLDLTHPYIQIIISDAQGNFQPTVVNGEPRECIYLKDVFAIPMNQIWPSNNSRINLRKSNQKPKLPLSPELHEIRRADPYYDEYCAKVAMADDPLAAA